MTQALLNDLTLEYETFGSSSHPAILLIMGLGSQLIHWPENFCQELATRGYYVIRYDNRDVGLSTKMERAKIPNIKLVALSLLFRLKPSIPYSLDDMAKDAIGLLDHLHIEKAHLVGASMGGMIAQLVAIHFPDRALSLTSIMSTTGNRSLPKAEPAAIAALTPPRAGMKNQKEIIQHQTDAWKTLMSPGYPSTDEALRLRLERVVQRSHYPQGMARQLAASICSPDRRKKLQKLTLPTAVIHGTADPLIPLACGKDTAENIPAAEFFPIEGMAHDFPEALIPRISDIVESAIKRCQTHNNKAETTPEELVLAK